MLVRLEVLEVLEIPRDKWRWMCVWVVVEEKYFERREVRFFLRGKHVKLYLISTVKVNLQNFLLLLLQMHIFLQSSTLAVCLFCSL